MMTSDNQHTRPLTEVLQDRRLLDLEGARAELIAVGLEVSRTQIARWATTRTLPFFMMGKRLVIQRAELHHALQKMQSAAVRGEDKRQSTRRRRRPH